MIGSSPPAPGDAGAVAAPDPAPPAGSVGVTGAPSVPPHATRTRARRLKKVSRRKGMRGVTVSLPPHWTVGTPQNRNARLPANPARLVPRGGTLGASRTA